MAHLKLKLDVSKLDKSAFFKGAKGTYVDVILWENDEPDQYGNTHSAKQDMGKDRKGEKTPYVGNAKPFGQDKLGIRSPEYGQQERPTHQNGAKPPTPTDDFQEDDDIPF